MTICPERAHEPPSCDHGFRGLIDGLWARECAALNLWARELAPTDELRRWYAHKPERVGEFDWRHRAGLAEQRRRLADLRRRARSGRATIVFGARDAAHSNVTKDNHVLRDGHSHRSAPR
jgi:uncharacterized protein YeaO (DUF488 family)